jgi:uncharacterized membrane protein YdfJ with MMPL/SSD domain
MVALWLAVVAASLPLAGQVTHHLSASGFEDPASRAVWADNQLVHVHPAPSQSPWLIEGVTPSRVARWADAAGLPADSLHIVGRDAVVAFGAADAPGRLTRLVEQARRAGASTTPVGDVSVGEKVLRDTKQTLSESLPVALPLLTVLLLVVFGSVAAALLPLVIAGAGSALALAVVDILEDHITLSAYLTDIVSFLALGVGVDYALFISVRYRQALADGQTPEEAVVESMSHAGRSVLYSGLAVALAVLTLVFGQNAYWRGIALGGAIAVACVLVATHTLLPALLRLLGPRIHWGRIPLRTRAGRFWPAVGRFVAGRPLAATGLAVVLLGVPAWFGTSLRMSTPANLAVLLPRSDPLRRAVSVQQQVLGPGSVAPLVVAVQLRTTVGDPVTWTTVRRLTARIATDPDVVAVASPLSFGLSPELVAGIERGTVPASPAVRQTLAGFTNPARAPHLVVLYVTSRSGPDAPATVRLVHRLDRLLTRMFPGRPVGVGGLTALLDGFNRLTAARLPVILAGVATVAFGVLFVATGALWQALLGVVFDALVALATAGLLVLTVQRGSLGLEALAPDSAITPLIFVLLFGLSMDYEVILLHRVQEFVRRGRDARSAASEGLALTGGMITGAGMIMVVVFIALLLSPLEIMKTLGIGLTAAILLDTWIVRSLLVPGSIGVLGHWAFWPWGSADRRSA